MKAAFKISPAFAATGEADGAAKNNVDLVSVSLNLQHVWKEAEQVVHPVVGEGALSDITKRLFPAPRVS